MITKFLKWLHTSWVYPIYFKWLNQEISNVGNRNKRCQGQFMPHGFPTRPYYEVSTAFGLMTKFCDWLYTIGMSKTLKPEIFFLVERKLYWDNAPSNRGKYDQYINNRVNDITTAMDRYNTGLKPVPVEWVEELLTLLHVQDIPTYSGDFV